MRVLLTGATGFVGSHVLDRLVARGDQVRVLALPETVEQLRHRDGVSIVAGSLADRDLLAGAARGVEVVYHLGGLLPGHPPEEIRIVNTLGTENLLYGCVRGRVRRLVFSSSASVYDESSWPLTGPITEQSPLRADGHGPIGPYAQSKIEAEKLIRRVHRRDGLEYVILRAPVVYGSGTRLDRQVLMQIINRPHLSSTPGARVANMQWINISDMADAVVLAGTRPEAANQIFNIAGEELFSLRDLTRMVWAILLNKPWADALASQLRAVHHQHLKYDVSEARRLLGYTSRVKLREGVEELVARVGSGSPTGV
jgi:UDP-glucose 4-epimerase